jgi:peptidoglycan hydrolase-like protein with peptidoglycan-binding domain
VAKVITKDLTYNPDVQALQTVLNALGYPCGEPDGKAGDNTLKGIAAFVAAHSEPVTAPTLPDTLTMAIVVGDKTYKAEFK